MKQFTVVALAAMSLLLALGMASNQAYAQKPKGIAIEIVRTPQNAPVHIHSLTSTDKFIESQTAVQSTSRKVIRTITFGVLLRIGDAGAHDSVFASKREIATNITPGTLRKIDVFNLSVADAEKMAAAFQRNSITAECGIVEVHFADGSTWESGWPGIRAASD